MIGVVHKLDHNLLTVYSSMTHRSLDAPNEREENEAAVMARCVPEGCFTSLFCVGSDHSDRCSVLRTLPASSRSSLAWGVVATLPKKSWLQPLLRQHYLPSRRSGLDTKVADLSLCFTVSYLRKQHAKEPATFEISALRWSWNSNWVSVCVWVTPLPTLPSCFYFLPSSDSDILFLLASRESLSVSLRLSAACGSMIGPQCPFREDN